jgi:uncharacterized Zn-binding protein involved in type VI secretion
MPKNVGRVTVDVAGGVLSTPLVPNVFVNGKPIAVVGTLITPHGKNPHAAAKMASGSPNVSAGGRPVCGNTDIASCGHPLVSTSNVFIN